jgi:hypothetical protein
MKPIKLTAIIFAAAVTVLATALVFSLIIRSKQPTKISAVPKTTNITAPKPIQPSEPVAEKPEAVNPKQLSQTMQKADKAAKPAIATKVASAPKAAKSAESAI